MLIYKITNKINGKVYVGQTLRTLKERWSSHKAKSRHKNYPLYNAFKKHGIENFIYEEIETLSQDATQNTLNEAECRWIAHFNSMCPSGYNLKEGGSNGKPSEETRVKLKIAATGRTGTNLGKPCSEETKIKLSVANKGQAPHNKGKPGPWRGKSSPFKGKKHSVEARAKISAANAKRKGIKRGPYKKSLLGPGII
jgi:group I intron endonuclease